MKSEQGKFVIHAQEVNVYVYEGGVRRRRRHTMRRPGAVTTAIKPIHGPHTMSVNPLPANVPVVQIGGVNCVIITGNSLSSSGYFPDAVYGMAYPQITGIDPVHNAQYFDPPGGAAQMSPLNGDGTWSLNVPVTLFDNVPGNPPNNTLLIWYEYDFIDEEGFPDTEFTVEMTTFHAFSPGGSTAPMQDELPADVAARTLVASFTGALAVLGAVKLAWNGVSWTGFVDHGGGSVLRLSRQDDYYELFATGPGTSFVAAGKLASFHPFSWEASGRAVGAAAGGFRVHITE